MGFALYSRRYATVTGRPGVHQEDPFFTPDFRNARLGEQVLARMAALAGERGVLEWWVLHSNPAAFAVPTTGRPRARRHCGLRPRVRDHCTVHERLLRDPTSVPAGKHRPKLDPERGARRVYSISRAPK